MKCAFAFEVILAAAGAVLAAPVLAETLKARAIDPGDFVYKAVLDGLTEDGVTLLLAASLAKNPDSEYPDFLAKCPLCAPTLRALKEYSERKYVAIPKEGKGLPTELAKRLESKDSATRRAAIRELVAGYMDRGYARITLTAEQRQTLEKELLSIRMVPKNNENGLKFCPSCDGACRLLPPKP
jgi:hypothetical protein